MSRDVNGRLSHGLATREDLERMREDPGLSIDKVKLAQYDAGNRCLLSFLDGKLAGYTWVDATGQPELLPGLVVRVPEEYLYLYAGLTLPDFRGMGLQAYRHYAVLEYERWCRRDGLLAIVRHTNWSSRRAVHKCGYRQIGSIFLVGTPSRFIAVLSRSLRQLGLERVAN
ncbi:hypothetical protein [Mycobacterium decipiens]|nr:hypothetical protein [Mycobacterium decipiens]